MIHERDYLRLKRPMIYASGDSCGKSQTIVPTIRGKWMHSLDKRLATKRSCIPTLSLWLHPHFHPRARLPARAMIKQRRGDALPLRRKNYGRRAAGKEQGRGRGGFGFTRGRIWRCNDTCSRAATETIFVRKYTVRVFARRYSRVFPYQVSLFFRENLS